jgi:hypothetical protein
MLAGEIEPHASTAQPARGRAVRRESWRETVLLTALIPLLGFACGVGDPFWLGGEFPWLTLIPLLIGVQHGLVAALVSAAGLCAGAWAHAAWVDQALPSAAVSYAAAAVVLGVIAGLGRDGSHQRHEQALRDRRRLTTRVEQYERAYHVLERSHEALVERLACGPVSLLHALNEARRELAQLHRWPELGGVVLQFLGQHAGVQAAAMYALSTHTRQLEPAAVARLGGVTPESERRDDASRVARNPLIARALHSGRLVSWVDVADADGLVRVAAPLRSSSGDVLGVIAIHELPFPSFDDQSLQELFALVLSLTDVIALQLGAATPRDRDASDTPRATSAPGIGGAATLRSRLRVLQARVPSRAGDTSRARPLASTQPWFTGPADTRAAQARPREASSSAAAPDPPASGKRPWGPVT